MQFLYHLSMDLQLGSYCAHYFTDSPHLVYMNSNSIITEANIKKLKHTQYLHYPVPNIFRTVFNIITKRATNRYPCISMVNDTSKKVVQVKFHPSTSSHCSISLNKNPFSQLQLVNAIVNECGITEDRIETFNLIGKESEVQAQQSNSTESRSKCIVNCFIDLKVTRQDIEKLPTGIHFLFAEALELHRLKPPIEIGAKAYELLLRTDLLEHTLRKTEAIGKGKSAAVFCHSIRNWIFL